MKQIPIPTACPLCSGKLLTYVSHLRVGTLDYCSRCSADDMSRFLIQYLPPIGGRLPRVEFMEVMPSNVRLKIDFDLSPRMSLDVYSENVWQSKIFIPWTHFDLSNIPSVEKKIRLLLAFS